jgi:hypothetical protein
VRPNSGVVDQDVDTAKLGQRSRRHRVDLVLFGDVGKNCERSDPKVPRFARDRLCLGPVGARVNYNVGAFSREFQRRRAADIAAGAGDQRDFPLELTHQRTSISDVIETIERSSACIFASLPPSLASRPLNAGSSMAILDYQFRLPGRMRRRPARPQFGWSCVTRPSLEPVYAEPSFRPRPSFGRVG